MLPRMYFDPPSWSQIGETDAWWWGAPEFRGKSPDEYWNKPGWIDDIVRPFAENGELPQMQTLACWYAANRNYDEAIQWWTRVANAGTNNFQRTAVRCLWTVYYKLWRADHSDENAEKVGEWLRFGDQIGDPESQFEYAIWLRDFRGTDDTDPTVQRLIRAAAKAGHERAAAVKLPKKRFWQ